MKKRHQFTAWAIAAGALVGSLATAQAELPVSKNTGIVQVTVTGGGRFSVIGLPFTRQPVGRDTVAVVASGTQFSTTVAWPDLTTLPHSVLVITGSNRGKTSRVTALTSGTTITIADSIALTPNLDEVEIIPDWTIGNLLGTGTNPSGLQSNVNPALADIVYLGGASSFTTYFHNGTNWRPVVPPVAVANNVSLGGLHGGVMILKRSAGDITINVAGVNRSGRTVTRINPGFNIVSYTDVGNATLGSSGLVPGLTTGSAATADLVIYPKATSAGLESFHHNGTEWRPTSPPFSNQNGKAVQSFRALVIHKKSAGTYEWPINESFAH